MNNYRDRGGSGKYPDAIFGADRVRLSDLVTAWRQCVRFVVREDFASRK